MNIEDIARITHEVNREYCKALGDNTQLPWDEAPEWQRESARLGVDLHLHSGKTTPAMSHESWMSQKLTDGWKHGAKKDEKKKTHPFIVPFNELPTEQKAKDYIFRAVVVALERHIQ